MMPIRSLGTGVPSLNLAANALSSSSFLCFAAFSLPFWIWRCSSPNDLKAARSSFSIGWFSLAATEPFRPAATDDRKAEVGFSAAALESD